jgi:hypothetical protein
MASVHTSQPPAAFVGHTNTKPQPASPHHTNPDSYLNAGLYASQGNYSNAPSPPPAQNYIGMPPQNTGGATFSAGSAPYNAGTTPYNAPVSPIAQQTYYGNDVKHTYVGAPHGGKSSDGATPDGNTQQTAELSGTATGTGGAAPTELPSGKTTWLDAITS